MAAGARTSAATATAAKKKDNVGARGKCEKSMTYGQRCFLVSTRRRGKRRKIEHGVLLLDGLEDDK